MKTYRTKELAPIQYDPAALPAAIRVRMSMLRMRFVDICETLGMRKNALANRAANGDRRSLRWWSVVLAVPEVTLAGDLSDLAQFPLPPPKYLERLRDAGLVGKNPDWEELAAVAWGGYMEEV
jgi:hypothetical protein